MDKKTTIQVIVALVFFSLTFYIYKNLNSLSLANFGNGSVQKVSSNENSLIDALLQRNFREEQTLVLSDPKFLSLQPSLAANPNTNGLKAGKKNPFEENRLAEDKGLEEPVSEASSTVSNNSGDETSSTTLEQSLGQNSGQGQSSTSPQGGTVDEELPIKN